MHFSEKIISFVIKIYFFKNFAKKISFALLLNRKSCICCHKHCRAYFRRHMECAVLKRFLKVQGTFSIKKFLQIPLSYLGKLNLIRFIKTFYKNLFPSSVTYVTSSPPRGKTLKPCFFYVKCKFIFPKMQWNCILLKVSLKPFQRLAGVDGVHGFGVR